MITVGFMYCAVYQLSVHQEKICSQAYMFHVWCDRYLIFSTFVSFDMNPNCVGTRPKWRLIWFRAEAEYQPKLVIRLNYFYSNESKINKCNAQARILMATAIKRRLWIITPDLISTRQSMTSPTSYSLSSSPPHSNGKKLKQRSHWKSSVRPKQIRYIGSHWSVIR